MTAALRPISMLRRDENTEGKPRKDAKIAKEMPKDAGQNVKKGKSGKAYLASISN
jgi:hypothetical protein